VGMLPKHAKLAGFYQNLVLLEKGRNEVLRGYCASKWFEDILKPVGLVRG